MNQLKYNKLEYSKMFYLKNKETILKKRKQRYANNREFENERNKRYNKKNKNHLRLYQKEWEKNNKEKRKIYQKQYFQKNKKLKNQARTLRIKTDPLFKMSCNLRTRTAKAFREILLIKKNKHTFEILGCSPQELKFYIEKRFVDRMNWNNQGKWKEDNEWTYGWDIDHIIPLSSAKNEEEMIKLCHYTNLQPLWHIDNIIKGEIKCLNH